MQDIQTSKAFEEVTQQSGRVMVEFYAGWCPDCKRIEPHFPEWEAKYQDEFTLVRANRDELPDIAEHLEILGIPTFIAYEDGKETKRLFSRDAKSKQQVEDFLDHAYKNT